MAATAPVRPRGVDLQPVPITRRTVLLTVPALPLAASTRAVSPANFPTVGDLYAEVRRLDAAIAAALDAEEADATGPETDQEPFQDARAEVIARVVATPARDVHGCKLKAELLIEVAEVDYDTVAEELLASLERDLDALDRAGA